MAFILKLKKGYYLYQFGQFAWTHLILLFVFVPSSFFVANIFDGIIWFLLPCSLVIINDIGAYLAGRGTHFAPLHAAPESHSKPIGTHCQNEHALPLQHESERSCMPGIQSWLHALHEDLACAREGRRDGGTEVVCRGDSLSGPEG